MQVFLAGEYYKNMGNAIKQIVWGVSFPMMLFLASPHTLVKFKGGQALAYSLLGGETSTVKIYTAGIAPSGGDKAEYYQRAIKQHRPFILESFYYADETTEKLLPYFGDFLLDSGAFTFMGGFSFTSNRNININWEEYLERYADFINRNKIEKFFELDIDSVVGYDKVKQFRRKLETMTNRQCIPVWHSTRGKEEYLRSCDEYPYVALGGIVGGEWNAKAEKYIPWFIKEAHKRDTKVHGLGYTKLGKLREYHFDSVDSTAWTTGNRFGFIYRFDGKTMVKYDVPKGKRIGDSKKVAMINYSEWIKFQKWAVNHL